MRHRDINVDLVVDAIRQDIERFNMLDQGESPDLPFMSIFKNSIAYIKKLFPGLSEADTIRLLELGIGLYNSKRTDKIEIVLTAPNSFRLKEERHIQSSMKSLKMQTKALC